MDRRLFRNRRTAEIICLREVSRDCFQIVMGDFFVHLSAAALSVLNYELIPMLDPHQTGPTVQEPYLVQRQTVSSFH